MNLKSSLSMNGYSKVLFWGALLLVTSCKNTSPKLANSSGLDAHLTGHVALKHAKEFKIDQSENSTVLSIHRKGEEDRYDTFHLVKSADDITNSQSDIQVPCKRIVCLSSTQLSYFFAMDAIDDIVAINSSRYLRHEGMKARVAAGEVTKIGKEGHFNLEAIAALDPDVIFVSPFKAGGYDALRSLGIPLVPMAAYNEETPLGRAEWVKMLALFIQHQKQADTIFNGIEARYQKLKTLSANVQKRPTVFSGKMQSGNWYVPGGNSFYAHYFRDAGADYIIKDNKQGAYPLNFETLYRQANQCDFWRIIYPESKDFTLDDLAAQDIRYADFKAFRDQNVLLCNIREKPYYEQAGMKPDVLLADYISFFHPELLPDYQPYFYERLQ
jgi:iron complex transport system substrate-binding protein